MSTVSLSEAQAHLSELLALLAPGERLHIELNTEYTATLVVEPRRTESSGLSESARQMAREGYRHYFGAVSSGNPRSADSELIDTDLAREFERTQRE